LQALAFKAYGEVAKRTAGNKEIEYALFLQITEALESVRDPETRSIIDWADAIHRNQQLWTIIATDLLLPGNALPDELKQSLIYLSDLIEVNKTVMAGLVRQSGFSVVEEEV
jgi:flagellar biosynthesis activator protein FlaF